MIPRSCREIVRCHLEPSAPLPRLSLLSLVWREKKVGESEVLGLFGGGARFVLPTPSLRIVFSMLRDPPPHGVWFCALPGSCFMTGDHDDDDLGETSQADVLRELQFLHT